MKWAVLLPCAAIFAYAGIDPDLPPAAPVVRSVFPQGGQRGTTVEVELSGQNLHDALAVEFAGRGVRAEVLYSLGTKVKMRVALDPTAEVGRRDFRLTTGLGVYVGVFDVGSLPEVQEKESNDDFRKPEPLTLPVLMNGSLGSEDWDHFRFRAAAGETLVFDVSATRHGSRLDADLAILSTAGEELAWVDDTTIFGDPHLEYTFPQAGEYLVRVGSLTGGGNYRLTAGRLPYVRRTFPAGLGAGQTTTLMLSGTHLDLVDEVWMGDRAVRGKILGKSSKELRAEFRLPRQFAAGPSRVHASHKGLEVAIPTEIRISDLPEVTVAAQPVSAASAIAVKPSLVVNGVIDQPKASHYFRFMAQAGERYTFSSESMKLGYHLDPTISVFDENGQKLAYADDPGGDDRSDEFQLDVDLSHTFEKTGTYFVAIRDGMYRGGDQLVYRLTMRRMEPDFIVELRDPVKTFYQGQQDTIQVRVRRRAGWSTPVEVWAEGLPAGVQAGKQSAPAKDSIVKDTCGVDRVIDGTIVLLPVQVSPDVNGRFDFRIKAKGEMNGRVVEHEAIVRYQHSAAGYVYGPMQVQKAQVTVVPAPDVMLSTADSVFIAPGGTRKLKVSLRRFGSAKQANLFLRATGTPQGVLVEATPAPAGAKDVEVVLRASGGAVNAPLRLEAATSAEGPAIGVSPPFAVVIQPENQARN